MDKWHELYQIVGSECPASINTAQALPTRIPTADKLPDEVWLPFVVWFVTFLFGRILHLAVCLLFITPTDGVSACSPQSFDIKL